MKNIDAMVNRFLSWPLPDDVGADVCATTPGYPHRSGTNLLTADQATKMFLHCVRDEEADFCVGTARQVVISLGDEVKDKVSGFQGVAVARHTYLNGCARISVQPKVSGDMKLPDSCTFDEPQLEVLTRGAVALGAQDTGGPEKYMPPARPVG